MLFLAAAPAARLQFKVQKHKDAAAEEGTEKS